MNQRRNMLRGLAAGGLSVWMSHLGAAGSQPPPPGVRKVLSVFGPGDRRIETSTATIGIRGTGCYIEGQENAVGRQPPFLGKIESRY